MKNLTYVLAALVLSVCFITACKKAENPVAVDKKSTTSKANAANNGGNPADTIVLVPLTGDQITLAPGFSPSAVGDSVSISFNAHTTNLYCAHGTLQYQAIIDYNKNFSIDFFNVREPSICPVGAKIPMVASPVLIRHANLANGNYPLKVTLNSTTYTGSITVTSANITFNWNYTSGVVISPKTLTR
ncbi:hypothetical protein SAMN05421821_104300 [Mucilaginibacter lappiensis]|uniref:Uncharacterized protein n=1 Tax=Mucilaginibacter lappiensis TaxID=354630 RepID=A0ABR6PI56_9SPHI|nr:hypothetical protein [Mucilaginibacter lappiensis]MBB6109288.1 hypothetical protein [Mucilaginibacter lappiensis]SIR01575.1 hypothetical protein SAMN05421821_104300 [Mucilaginibacter lappiensis]